MVYMVYMVYGNLPEPGAVNCVQDHLGGKKLAIYNKNTVGKSQIHD